MSDSPANTGLRRRQFLAAAGTVALAASAGSTANREVGDFGVEPSATEIRKVDGTPVLFRFGQPAPRFDTWKENSKPRDHVSLNGAWLFRFDPNDVGKKEDWAAPDHDTTDWQTVQVPRPWDLYDTPDFWSYDGSNYGRGTAFTDGVAWYRTQFYAPRHWGERAVDLTFLGANNIADVYLNGTHLGRHQGANLPFALDTADALNTGEENVLAVRIYRRKWWLSYTSAIPIPVNAETDVPPNPVDYWPYAGLVRDVYVQSTNRASVRALLTDASDGALTVYPVIFNRNSHPVSVDLRVDPGAGSGGTPVTASFKVGADGVRVPTVSTAIPNAESWSLSSPTTYEATAELTTKDGALLDRLSTTYGARQVSVSGTDLTLNGDSLFLKGVDWHEETPPRGRSLEPEDYSTILDQVEDLGVNYLRNSHYTRHPAFYEAANDRGVLVLDETENVWLHPDQEWVQVNSYGLSRALVATMTWNQHNHPCVGFWSIQNESNPHGWAYRPWLADMKDAVKTLDRQRRPVTWASPTTKDPAFDLADVIGVNEYFGFFYGSNDDVGPALDDLHDRYPDKPILVTENGTWSAPQLRGGDANDPSVPGTPEWQATSLRSHWNQVTAPKRSDYMTGYTYWLLHDYKERDGYNRFSYNGISTMGLLSIDDERKTLAYHTYKSLGNPME